MMLTPSLTALRLSASPIKRGSMAKKKPISEEDFSSWKDNRITQAVFAHLNEVKGQISERWIGLLNEEIAADPRLMQLVQVELKGKLEFIADMIGLELSDIQEEEDDGARGRNTGGVLGRDSTRHSNTNGY